MKHLDLIDWTIQKAARLRPAEKQTVSALDGPSSTDNTMEVFEPERAKLSTDDKNQTPGAPGIRIMTEQVATPLPSNVVVAAPKAAGAEGSPAAPSISAETLLREPNSNQLKAITAPAEQIDLARAIHLRWVLRDIKSDRLKSTVRMIYGC